MKKILAVLILLSIIFTGCQTTNVNNKNIVYFLSPKTDAVNIESSLEQLLPHLDFQYSDHIDSNRGGYYLVIALKDQDNSDVLENSRFLFGPGSGPNHGFGGSSNGTIFFTYLEIDNISSFSNRFNELIDQGNFFPPEMMDLFKKNISVLIDSEQINKEEIHPEEINDQEIRDEDTTVETLEKDYPMNEYSEALIGYWEALIGFRDFRITLKDDGTGRVSSYLNNFNDKEFKYRATEKSIYLLFNQSVKDGEKEINYSLTENLLVINWDINIFNEGYGFIEGDVYYNYMGPPINGRYSTNEVDTSGFIATVWLNSQISYDHIENDYIAEYDTVYRILTDNTYSKTTIKKWMESNKIDYVFPQFISYLTWLCIEENYSIEKIEKGMMKFVSFFNKNYMDNEDAFRFQGRYVALSSYPFSGYTDILSKLSDPFSESFHHAFNPDEAIPMGIDGDKSFFFNGIDLRKL